MLKWTVINRRQSENGEQQYTRRHSNNFKNLQDNPIQKSKRRRSANSRLSSGGPHHRRTHKRRSLNTNSENKENHFTSTPIKSPDNCFHAEALRDVSNITPKDVKIPIKILTSNQKKHLSPKHVKHKKKKRCLDPTHGNPNFPNCFETIQDLNEKCNCGSNIFKEKSSTPKNIVEAYAPTLPTFDVEYSPCGLRSSPNFLMFNADRILSQIDPANNKVKIDHINDFLHQISYITSPEDKQVDANNIPLRMSPLVQKLVGLRFTPQKAVEKHNDSSFINNLSLNELVNAILDSSTENNNKKDLKNVNTCKKQDNESFSDKNSTDSGFRSNTDSHNTFSCQCHNICHNLKVPAFNCDKTIINIDETFNERCVDVEVTTRKRSSSDIREQDLQCKEGFTLKRQRCIRRRRLIEEVKTVNQTTNSIYWDVDNIWNDNSFQSSFSEHANNLKNSVKEAVDEYVSDDEDDVDENLCRPRRCLLFDSPISDSSSIASNKQIVSGSMELEIEYGSNEVVLTGIFFI